MGYFYAIKLNKKNVKNRNSLQNKRFVLEENSLGEERFFSCEEGAVNLKEGGFILL